MRVRQRAHALRVIWAPSLARRLLRHRFVQVAVVLMLGVVVALLVLSKATALERQRSQWQERVPVAVVQSPVLVGDHVAPAVKIESWPRAMVPPGAIGLVGPESLAKVALYPGEIVLQARVTSPGTDRKGPVTVTLTLPVSVQVPLLQRGDLVDLWIVDSANLSSQRAVEHVVVLAFSDRDITVAVPQDQVEAATAASLRPVTIALVG